jgi:hypothetical protein
MELVDLMPLHPLLRHPHTGEPLRAIVQMDDGEYLWPLLGADGEGDDNGDENNEDDGVEDQDDPEDDAADDKGGKTPKGKAKGDTVSREEYERLLTRMKAADRNRAEAQRKAEEYERKDKTELENAQADLKKAVEQHEKLQGNFKTLALTNAFLIASQRADIVWHNVKVAQKAAELGELEVDPDTGEVDGIDKAIKALAKEQPYLVKGKENAEDEEDDGEKKPKPRGTSGSGVGSTKTPKGKPNNGKLTEDELRRRFPALRK